MNNDDRPFDPSRTEDYAPRSSDGDDATDDPRVLEIVQAYMAELDRGNSPSIDAYVNRYPPLSAAIRQCLEGLQLLHGGLRSDEYLSNDSSTSGTLARLNADRPPNPLGDFQIVRELARGGMGVVYEAIQLSLGRPVALKVLPFAAAFDEKQLQRFKNEAQAAALLHHTNIVPIYAVGCERGVHFYAMQLIAGQSLADIIKQLRTTKNAVPAESHSSHVLSGGGETSASATSASNSSARSSTTNASSTLAISAALTSRSTSERDGYYRGIARLIVQAANALEHAHQHGVIHRDIKPANLLVNAAGNLWITDFGLAQLQADNGLTRTGDLVGTMRYMSPEQTAGRRTMLDHRTDVYSLGATFYELLTLEPVYAAETRQELLFQILHDEPRLPRALQKQIPVELETIVLKSLAKTPAERYSSAAEFAADVQRYLDNQPIQARRPSWIDHTRKWARRHPSAVIAAVLMLLVIAVASLVTNWIVAREQQRTEVARRNEAQRADEAELRFQQARTAVDLLVKISEEELADKPLVQSARRRLLQTALTYYEEFIEQREGNAESQAELAAAQERVKGILYELEVLQRESQIWLLGQSAVQADLALSDDQRSRVTELLRTWAEERNSVYRDADADNEEQRRRRFVEMAESHELALRETLDANQLQRLYQIALQTQGVFAFKEPAIVKRLQLTPDQQAAMRLLERQAFQRGFNFFTRDSSGNSTSRDRPRSYPSRREEIFAKAIALLSDEQKRRWQELVGAPFTSVDDRNFFGGGRRPGSTSGEKP